MPSNYQITVNMSAATVSDLLASGFVLWALIPVQCSDTAALPVAWHDVQNYSTITNLSWSLAPLAYTSFTQFEAGNQVAIGFSAEIEPGQVLNVGPGGVGTVASSGIPATITLLNTTSTPFTSGLALELDTSPLPICAAPLYGNNIQCILPMSQVFLMFSNQPLKPFQIVTYSTGSGLLANFAVANTQSLQVNYDIDSGWAWGGLAWGSAYPPLTNLQQLLVQQPVSAVLANEGKWRKSLQRR